MIVFLFSNVEDVQYFDFATAIKINNNSQFFNYSVCKITYKNIEDYVNVKEKYYKIYKTIMERTIYIKEMDTYSEFKDVLDTYINDRDVIFDVIEITFI